METAKLCANCGYFIRNGHCSLTEIPTELYQTCELHKFRAKAVKETSPVVKVFTGGFIFTIVVFVLKMWLGAEQLKTKKSSDDMLKFVYELQKRSSYDMDLLHYLPVVDTLNMRHFIGFFYTNDLEYPERQFRESLPKYFDKIPFSDKGNKKIFVENKLYFRSMGSDVLIAEICGQIEYVAGSKYFYETNKLIINKIQENKKGENKKKTRDNKTHTRRMPKKGKGVVQK